MVFIGVREIPGYVYGSGFFIFGGCLFFFPIKLFYKAPGVKINTIAYFSWTYTYLLFALSVRLGFYFTISGWTIVKTVLLFQTILYTITLVPFYYLLKSKFIYILDNIGEKELFALMWVTMIWFWTLFITNLSFAFPIVQPLMIITLLILGVCIFISFGYIYLQVNSGKTIQYLEKIVYLDELTQLRSRIVLGKDAEDLLVRNIPFNLIFFDLDDFKNINDQYGHQMGDRYLSFFAHEIKVRIGNDGGFYRIAGDEFICIISVEAADAFLEEIRTLPDTLPDTQVKFLGFSYGIATFPDDGDTVDDLLHCADLRMYAMKMPKKYTRRPVEIGAGFYKSV
jgi:diguanylate cyclase (GGDEF)-like protein